MAIAINKLGQWALELHSNVEQILGYQNTELIQAYHSIFQRLISKALELVDTDKARIALPLMDFFTQFLKSSHLKKGLDPNSESFKQIGQLSLTIVKWFHYPQWFIEMAGHTENSDDWSDGRLNEHKALREAQILIFARLCNITCIN